MEAVEASWVTGALRERALVVRRMVRPITKVWILPLMDRISIILYLILVMTSHLN
jgi:hypothetical protein